MTIEHISCAMLKPIVSDLEPTGKFFGEYDAKIDEIEFYEADELVEFITDQPSMKDQLQDLLTKYIKEQVDSLGLSKKLYYFELSISKDPLGAKEHDELSKVTVTAILSRSQNFNRSIV
mmetsp:Transcript_21317/g.24509  ORF Transcript_21317/g.24509 Transcript_21317/m.24509 type:complete len:119 (-) Transcript_21317:6-362(-)